MDSLSCWWQFNYRTKSLENRVCFSVWMAITGVIYHVNRVSSSSSIRTEGGHTSIQCHPAVQRNPGNYQQQRVEGGKPVRWRPVAGHRGHRQHLPSQSQWQCDIASARAVVRLGVRFLVNPTIWGRFRLRGRVCGHKMEAWWPQRPNWGRPMCAMSNTCKRKTYPDWPMNNHSFAGNQNFSYSFPWPEILLVCELFFLFLKKTLFTKVIGLESRVVPTLFKWETLSREELFKGADSFHIHCKTMKELYRSQICHCRHCRRQCKIFASAQCAFCQVCFPSNRTSWDMS